MRTIKSNADRNEKGEYNSGAKEKEFGNLTCENLGKHSYGNRMQRLRNIKVISANMNVSNFIIIIIILSKTRCEIEQYL